MQLLCVSSQRIIAPSGFSVTNLAGAFQKKTLRSSPDPFAKATTPPTIETRAAPTRVPDCEPDGETF
jgi:hypothetical protein